MSNEKTTVKNLRDRAKAFDIQLPLMEGREKGETKDLLAQVSVITDYGFIPNEAGEPYVVFITKERPDKFYFGGSVLTSKMTELETEGYHNEIINEGLPVLFTTVKSKNGRGYTNAKFYPED